LNFKELIKQIDIVAGDWLPLPQPVNEAIVAWASLHGWNVLDKECERLLVRQALFNATLQQITSNTTGSKWATPLDLLNIEAPQSLKSVVYDMAQSSQTTLFNFWGEFYSALIPQARRRHIGQFWTNELIAEWMIDWLLQSHPRYLADIGCGAGNFLLKTGQRLINLNDFPELYGCEVSPLLLNATLAAFLTRYGEQSPLMPTLVVQDYLDGLLPPTVDAVICNPPYTRHHHIAPELKDKLQALFKSQFRLDVSRQGTLAFYFLLKLIAEMPDDAHAAIIVPMETVDARYGRAARRILCEHTTLSAIVHFSPQMNAFHKVDVGASILFFKKGYQVGNQVRHLTLDALPTSAELLACLEIEHPVKCDIPFGSLVVQPQEELLETSKWFSLATPPSSDASWERSGRVVRLKELAKVVRGIATGANKFFALPTQKVEHFSLQPYVVRTLQRNREIQDIILDEAGWHSLSNEGKCVWLLYLNGENVIGSPQLRDYLAEGEAEGYHRRSLVQTRRKWYAMEQRDIPAIFFTILTRGNPRFILNQAGVRPLNMFSLIYPNRYIMEAGATELLWALLNSSFSLSRLHSVSRTYGGNTLKVEPRELDNLPVINPLALPSDTQQKIRGWITDFYRHRQTSILLRQIDALVETLLVAEIPDTIHSSLPIQLRLLQTEAEYNGSDVSNSL
jgi:methylase of polypeptide subunit release factors